MALRFIGISADSDGGDSPTIWLDGTNGDLIIQSYTADAETVQEAARVGSVPGHATEIPAHESMIRLPAHMLPFVTQVQQEG